MLWTPDQSSFSDKPSSMSDSKCQYLSAPFLRLETFADIIDLAVADDVAVVDVAVVDVAVVDVAVVDVIIVAVAAVVEVVDTDVLMEAVGLSSLQPLLH